MTQEQIDYVLGQLQSNVEELTIFNNLSEAGYSDEDIANLITAAKAQLTDPSKSKPTNFYLAVGIFLFIIILLVTGLYLFMSKKSAPELQPQTNQDSEQVTNINNISFKQYTEHDQLVFEIPTNWRDDEQIGDGVSQLSFYNPESDNEAISITTFTDIPQTTNSPIALDLFVLGRTALFEAESEKLSSRITEVSDTQARTSSFSKGDSFNTIRVVHFLRNGIYYEVLASLNSASRDDVFNQVINSINFKQPIDDKNNYIQNDALFESKNVELFTLINKINFFVKEMSSGDSIPTLTCSLVDHPTKGLEELKNISSSCTANEEGFAISFETALGYYCIDSVGTHSYWGSQLLSSPHGKCLENNN